MRKHIALAEKMTRLVSAAVLHQLADIGTVFLPCVAVFAATVGALEFLRPGVAASAVAPQLLAGLAVLCCALALVAPAPPRRSWYGLALYGAFAAIITKFAFWGADFYFKAMGGGLKWAVGLTVGLWLLSAALPAEEVT